MRGSKNSTGFYTIPTLIRWINMTILLNKNRNLNFTFARLSKTRNLYMNYISKTIVLIATLLLGSSVSMAQWDTPPDSTVYDPYAVDTTSTYSEAEAPAVVKKPYIRFVTPFDTITELVTYTEIISEEEAGTDSLYWRAKRWINHEFGKKNQKKLIKKDDKKDFKIVMEGEFPLYIEANKFAKTQNGKVVFDMEIKFKEGRYRYKINNLVHVVPPPPGEEKETRTYFEFYRKSTINPRGNDIILMNADKKIKSMISDLKKYCKEPIFVDEDDW
jgi:hypothetical protein